MLAHINVDLASVTGPSNLTMTNVCIYFIQATAKTKKRLCANLNHI